ncbi:DUF4012 domain-containing protein [Arthrobacter sp. H14-L1]|uniref:DUF4012 domain-containing protein n=1 Tax=Arthrobacter sp. H14-L1 TaxID=2996697 RepID=UPI00226E5BBB|nr:DUF4012 domain-containing protein [Arthrobacter sp. H14-L1]MCY0905472.1 DUF4012 domain-containing protein [Arthrobacter sp. H14-L1]
MADSPVLDGQSESSPEETGPSRHGTRPAAGQRRRRRKKQLRVGIVVVVLVVVVGGAGAWLGFRAGQLKDNLQATAQLLPQLKTELMNQDQTAAAATIGELETHTAAARAAGTDPLWKAASGLPWLGANFSAASEVAVTADDVIRLAGAPMVDAFASLDRKSLTPVNGAVSLEPLKKAAPSVVSAANTVQLSYDRLASIDGTALLPQLSGPLAGAKTQLDEVRKALNVASSAATLIPPMMGADGPRNYLLLIQNSAEIRATGGIPGALAIIRADHGKIELAGQGSASTLGAFEPPIAVDPAQESIYTNRLGSFIQDVNLTPDFPTSAKAAKAMWEQRFPGQEIDGVISVDPVALSQVLSVTGPVDVAAELPAKVGVSGLPSRITSENLVKTMLSDVYAKIADPAQQDVYFSIVAKQVFDAFSAGNGSAEDLAKVLATSVTEGRVLLWSASSDEQQLIDGQTISGAVSGPSVPAAGFGVYFNDGTGAKMDYYVKRTVQLVQRCSANGYAQYTARIKMTNTAPLDAATSLPKYVTGDGFYGVELGSVATDVVTYGPALARTQAARIDGQAAGLGSFSHAERPVAVVRVQLAPGESKTIEVDFSKVVQTDHAQLEVTPTIEKLSDVVLPDEKAANCQ